MNRIYNYSIIIMLSLFTFIFAAEEESKQDNYVIEQPGTITFTSGVKIAGKVEKPQVMIFMSKEDGIIQKPQFNHSFKNEILKTIEQQPVLKKE